jgi:hypothetical protein
MKRLAVVVLLLLVVPCLAFGQTTPQKVPPAKADSVTQPVRPLTTVVYLQQSGEPRVLLDADNKEIVRVEAGTEPKSGKMQRVAKVVATGEVILTGDTKETTRYLCLDASGAIVRKGGTPLLVAPFEVFTSVSKGQQLSFETYDLGRPDKRYILVLDLPSIK